MRKTWQSHLVKIWFVLDAVIALAPPLYWAANSYQASILGLPSTLFYFLAVSVSIITSIVYAYRVEVASGECPAC